MNLQHWTRELCELETAFLADFHPTLGYTQVVAPTTREARYWAKVDRAKPDECWEWTAFRNPCGYGIFRWGREQLAHRFGYRLAYGTIPANGQVLHSCDNPPCQNPAHLFLGNPAVNMADKVAKGRQSRSSLPGERNGQAKMTTAQIIETRKRYLAGESQQSIAAALGTHQRNVSRIVRGERWGHLPTSVVDGRQRRSRGTANPASKLTMEQVAEIRRAYTDGASQTELGVRFGVAQTTISRIVRGRGYANSKPLTS